MSLPRFILFLLLILPAIAVAATPGERPVVENIEALIALAMANNPEVKGARAHGEMLANKARQAGSLEDPMLMLKFQNMPLSNPTSFDRESMTQKVIGVSQQLPWYGKLKLRKEVAARDAESAHWIRLEKSLELIRSVKETFYQLYFTDKSLGIATRNLAILETFVNLAETRYTVGQGSQADIFKAQVEQSKVLDMRLSLEQQRKSLAIRLNTLLSRPVTTPVGSIPEITVADQPETYERLLQTAEEQRPLLKGVRAAIEKGKAAHALGKSEFYPDFNASLEYMQRQPAMGSNGDDLYSVGVTFNLPFQRERRHAALAEAESEVTMAMEELNAVRNALAGEIADLLVRMGRRKRQAELYRSGIIPQAEKALEAATNGYRTGKVDFLSLLDSRMTLFSYEREYYESLAEYMMSLSQLEAAVGVTPEPISHHGHPSNIPSSSTVTLPPSGISATSVGR